jgi:hypothetical protein
MRTGAFQLVLQMIQPTLRNSTVKVVVMLVSFSAIDMWAHKVDVIDTTALTVAVVGTIGCDSTFPVTRLHGANPANLLTGILSLNESLW